MDMQKLIIWGLGEHEVLLKGVLNFNQKFKLCEN
jgi:hypothetical protein